MTQPIAVASAPCSFGAFEVTVGVYAGVPDGRDVLDAVQRAGYAGIDLGPIDYLGTAEELGERLQARGLHLAGGFCALPFSEPALLKPALATLHAVLDRFDAAPRVAGLPNPKPTLADAGSEVRRAAPGQASRDRSLGLDAAGWERLGAGVRQAVALCRARGYDPTFHHHAATYVEAPWEIDELLARTDVGLCLDTGHLALAGGEPVEAVRRWGARINHLHLKNVRCQVIDAIVAEGAPVIDVWRRSAFCRLDEGDLDLDRLLAAVRESGYRGWLVVEQDTLPEPVRPPEQAGRDQERNRAYLRARGL